MLLLVLALISRCTPGVAWDVPCYVLDHLPFMKDMIQSVTLNQLFYPDRMWTKLYRESMSQLLVGHFASIVNIEKCPSSEPL